MTEFTNELMVEISKLRGKSRRNAIVALGKQEFARCADDPIYWLDASAHPVPYVYTLDPHPFWECNICKDGEGRAFNKRTIHLSYRHNIECEDERELRGYFTALPTTRIFTLFDYMIPIIKAWLQQQFVFAQKSRDMTMTWLIVALYTWDTLFHPGRQNIFQSKNASKTAELVRRAKFIYDHQPKFLRTLHKAYYNMGTVRSGELLIPSLNSEILGFPQGPDQIRQYHPSGIFQDEAAFQEKAGDAFASIKPAIQCGGRFTAVSSANPGWFMLCCRDQNEEG